MYLMRKKQVMHLVRKIKQQFIQLRKTIFYSAMFDKKNQVRYYKLFLVVGNTIITRFALGRYLLERNLEMRKVELSTYDFVLFSFAKVFTNLPFL